MLSFLCDFGEVSEAVPEAVPEAFRTTIIIWFTSRIVAAVVAGLGSVVTLSWMLEISSLLIYVSTSLNLVVFDDLCFGDFCDGCTDCVGGSCADAMIVVSSVDLDRISTFWAISLVVVFVGIGVDEIELGAVEVATPMEAAEEAYDTGSDAGGTRIGSNCRAGSAGTGGIDMS